MLLRIEFTHFSTIFLVNGRPFCSMLSILSFYRKVSKFNKNATFHKCVKQQDGKLQLSATLVAIIKSRIGQGVMLADHASWSPVKRASEV